MKKLAFLIILTTQISCSENIIDDGDEGFVPQTNIIPLPKETDAIDLGLSVRWASFNVGATKPEEYGNYYAWGEIEPKLQYDYETYIGYSSDELFWGNMADTYGTSKDVAHVKWGGRWRIPTLAEIYELRDNCICTETTLNNVKGIRFTGKNGNSIFLPAAGRCEGRIFIDVGKTGHYWQGCANSTGDQTGEVPYYDLNSIYYGLSIRAVYAE